MSINTAVVVRETKEWLQKAVIGLNLCPFAKPVYTQDLIRYRVTEARTEDELLTVLETELRLLAEKPITEIETTLIIHPLMLGDFKKYNEFLNYADAALVAMDLEGVVQVASFHPQYQFAGTSPSDISNYTNRSPYPTLHLLREESVTRAVDSAVDVDAIPDRNIATMEKLGLEGWKKLGIPNT